MVFLGTSHVCQEVYILLSTFRFLPVNLFFLTKASYSRVEKKKSFSLFYISNILNFKMYRGIVSINAKLTRQKSTPSTSRTSEKKCFRLLGLNRVIDDF